MKKLIASTLCVVMVLGLTPGQLVAAGRSQPGQISGLATVDGKPQANTMVRLRSVDTGRLVGTALTNSQGRFSFTALASGTFLVESVSSDGTILGTSSVISLNDAEIRASEVTVRTSAAVFDSAKGIGRFAQEGAAAAGGGGGMSATAMALLAVALGLGAVGVVVATNDASPSR